MKYFVILLVMLTFLSLNEALAETVFSKDIGAGLSPEECQKRYDNRGGFYEPLLELAKFKTQNHPIFKELTENDSFKIVSTGVRSSPYSENCDMDLPTFEIHYATNMTDNSYTRIYMNIDNTTYDVAEITTRMIDNPANERPKSKPLPFYNTNWKEAHMEGIYHGTEPPKPSQTFKIPYIAVNGKITDFKTNAGTITAKISAKDWSIFAVKIPRNYPYTDHDDSLHQSHGFEPFAIITNDSSDVFAHTTRDDCFYNVWMKVSGNKTIEMPITTSYLQGDPMHGDNDLPPFCKSKTIVDEKRDEIAKLPPLKQVENGVYPYHVSCKDGWYLIVKHDKTPACVSHNAASKLWHRGWADKSTDIYAEHSTPEIRNAFNSKLKDKNDALQIAEDFINITNLVLKDTNPDFKITSSLSYVNSDGKDMLKIDTDTGLPTQIAVFDNEGFYRTPHWYAELQKDYLGMPSDRIEHGNVAWEVAYRECSLCMNYSAFTIDAITGKVIDTYKVENMFDVKYEYRD